MQPGAKPTGATPRAALEVWEFHPRRFELEIAHIPIATESKPPIFGEILTFLGITTSCRGTMWSVPPGSGDASEARPFFPNFSVIPPEVGQLPGFRPFP